MEHLLHPVVAAVTDRRAAGPPDRLRRRLRLPPTTAPPRTTLLRGRTVGRHGRLSGLGTPTPSLGRFDETCRLAVLPTRRVVVQRNDPDQRDGRLDHPAPGPATGTERSGRGGRRRHV